MSGDPPRRPPPQKTVIGGLPPAGGGGDPFAPRPAPLPGAGGPAAPQKTVIGGLPPAGGSGGFAPQPAPGGFGAPPAARDPFAVGGPGAPAQHPAQGFGGQPGHGADPNAARAWMGAQAPQDSFFPDVARPHQAPARTGAVRKIALEEALRARGAGHSAGSNPLTAAAAGLLVLFGRLRSQVVDMEALPLMTHVTHEIEAFERTAIDGGADPQDALIAKYALCGTADDIVQNLPGTDRHIWVQYSMVARFFNRRTSGVGFFQEVEKALADPIRKYNLLELMLTCLQLGFEGQYRTMPGGEVELQRIRRQVFETLRRVRPRGDDDIAPNWQGIEIAARRQGARVPVWVVASVCAALLAGSYMGMRILLTEDAGLVATKMRSLHPTEGLTIARASTVPGIPVETTVYEPPPPPRITQLERVREALAGYIADGTLGVDTAGNFIAITANNLVLFDSGAADVRPAFAEVAGSIARVLEAEEGEVRIVGHTDNVPLSGRGRFKNNYELSVARAQSVERMIAPGLSDPSRIEVIGRGEDEPIADNATAEGRAENRRVEILIRRDGQL